MSYADFNNLSPRHQAFLLLSVLRDGEKAPSLLDHLVDVPQDKFRNVLGEMAKAPRAQLKKDLWDPMVNLPEGEAAQMFQFAESGWIVENFKGESPRILAWIMTHIPKAKAGRVLSELPKEVRKALKTVKLPALSPGLEAFLRKRCEERFPRIPVEEVRGKGIFESLSELKPEHFLKLIRELGINEMSIAFSKIDRAATRAILHRLNLQDAKELRQRIKKGGDHPLAEQREAQLSLLSLDLETVSPDELPFEIGFSVFSRAFGKENSGVAPLFIYKLPQRQGYLLKRYIDQNSAGNKPEIMEKIQQRIAEALGRVQEQLQAGE